MAHSSSILFTNIFTKIAETVEDRRSIGGEEIVEELLVHAVLLL